MWIKCLILLFITSQVMAPLGFSAKGLRQYGVFKGQVLKGEGERHLDSPHYLLRLVGGDLVYLIPIAIRSRQDPHEMRFLEVKSFSHPVTKHLKNLPSGYTNLDTHADRAILALDYVRGKLFSHETMAVISHDVPGPNNDLNDTLTRLVERALSAKATVYAYGEPFNGRDDFQGGLHNIHQNQGSDGGWRRKNAPNQDGALLIEFPNNEWIALFFVFQNQSMDTDAEGHPK